MLNRLKYFLLALAVCLVPVAAQALVLEESVEDDFEVKHRQAVNEGEPFMLHIAGGATVEDLKVVWLGKEIPLAGQGKAADLLLPVPLEHTEESIALLILSEQGYRVYSAAIEVKKKDFPAQSLTVDPRFVTPPESELPRIQREAKKSREIYAAVTPVRYWRVPLVRPLPGIVTSEFGVRRMFNGEPRSRHRGVDFRGAEGTEIRSVAAGKVVLVEDQYYSGNMIIIDHGFGVYSNYCHMSAFKVKEGDLVEAGQTIGLVGQTGRVTGPHLHLSFLVLGQSVTPEPLMPGFRPAG